MMKARLFMASILLLLVPSICFGIQVYQKGDVSLSIGYWGQAWYQYVSGFDRDGDGTFDDHLNDFMIRRTYLSVSGTATDRISFFLHYAGDRIGQEGLDNPGVGLGSSLALRDAWVTYKVLGNDLMVQVGRMYVPFTRNYGTTSTKTLLTTELNWGQGGLRSGIFYPSKVGRDDGVTLWGNILDDKLQYRFMAAEGVEDTAANPDDTLRFAGRLSFNLFDPETTWFNKGTTLGKKKILALGFGYDSQKDISTGDYRGYTADIHLDLPFEGGALTAEAAYIWLDNTPNAITWTDWAAGDDGDIASIQVGVLAGAVQPFVHCQKIMPDGSGKKDAWVYGAGANYYLAGLANKLTAEWSIVDTGYKKVDLVTLQVAFGF